MDALLLIGAGVFLAGATDWCWTFWRRAENSHARADAEKVLTAHGLSAHAYLATVGTEDAELREALDQFAFTGHIVLDKQGNVVGRLLPKVAKGPHLRLVVDNSK